MKTIKYLFTVLLASTLFTGCYKDDLDTLQDQVDVLEERVEALEKIMAALEMKDYVTSVTPLSDGSGYVISFEKSGDITIHHGKDGANGKDGNAWFSSIKIEGNNLILTLSENGQIITIPYQSPGFGFHSSLPDGPLSIPHTDTIIVNLPSEYQTIKAEIEPLDSNYSITPTTRASATAILGEWQVSVKPDELGTNALIIIKAEFPEYWEALLSVSLIDMDGVEHKLNKVIKLNTDEDFIYDSATNTYTVKSASGLTMINKLLNRLMYDDDPDNNAVNITLANDIEFGYDEYDPWIPVSGKGGTRRMVAYKGTFDGAGYKISDLYFESADYKYVSLFAMLDKEGVIKNLTLEDVYFTNNHESGNAAAVVGANHGTVMDCAVKPSSEYMVPTAIKAKDKAAILVCENYGSILCCSLSGYRMIAEAENAAAGIAAVNEGNIDQCDINAVISIRAYIETGGIAGLNNGTITNSSIQSSRNSGLTVKGCHDTGGIVGYNIGEIINCSVSKVYVTVGTAPADLEELPYRTGKIPASIVGYNNGGIIVGCLANAVECAYKSGFESPTGLVGLQDDGGSLIGCYSYQSMINDIAGDSKMYYQDQKGIIGINEDAAISQCYYQGETGTPLIGFDTEGSALATVWADTTGQDDGAMTKMNLAVDKYNESAKIKCTKKWSGDATNPSLK